jgi:hypothetical protein
VAFLLSESGFTEFENFQNIKIICFGFYSVNSIILKILIQTEKVFNGIKKATGCITSVAFFILNSRLAISNFVDTQLIHKSV